jgi:hypothetical protein
MQGIDLVRLIDAEVHHDAGDEFVWDTPPPCREGRAVEVGFEGCDVRREVAVMRQPIWGEGSSSMPSASKKPAAAPTSVTTRLTEPTRGFISHRLLV